MIFNEQADLVNNQQKTKNPYMWLQSRNSRSCYAHESY